MENRIFKKIALWGKNSFYAFVGGTFPFRIVISFKKVLIHKAIVNKKYIDQAKKYGLQPWRSSGQASQPKSQSTYIILYSKPIKQSVQLLNDGRMSEWW